VSAPAMATRAARALRGRAQLSDRLAVTADWIASHQRSDGALPSFRRRRMDPWDHVQSAMALAAMGRIDAARAAYRYSGSSQHPNGAWPAASNQHGVIDATQESNHAAYLATGLWHFYRVTGEVDLLAELWPALERAVGFVLQLQDDSGVIYWATDGDGIPWPAPLLAGCSSIYGSLGCAVRIAARLGQPRERWQSARTKLGQALRQDQNRFVLAAVPEPPGRYAMDWYYPVLGGALRGEAGRRRLIDGHGEFIDEGTGCRCVRDRAWYTVAETCELVIALALSGLREQAQALFDWTASLRCEDGGYWMGITYPNQLCWPPERPSWTAATVILAAHVLAAEPATSGLFESLADL